MGERRGMVEPESPLSLRRQAALLGLHRSGLYYRPVPVDPGELELMALLDRQHMRAPFYGYRKMTEYLRGEGHAVNHKRVARLMRLMGIGAIYSGPGTSVPDRAHKVYPYLLRGLPITGPDQVWATDITYVPMRSGFMYLMAIMDLYSRYVLEWSVSNTMEAEWCAGTLERALRRHGRPAIFNTDQGSQFTADVFIEVLVSNGIRPSMDGKGRATDNIFVERLWRSVKYEDIYLKAYEDGWQLEKGMGEYFRFYNMERLHQSLKYKTPGMMYEGEKDKNKGQNIVYN